MSDAVTVYLKIRHPSVDPDVLTQLFGVAPEFSWKAGEAKPAGRDQATRRESF